jgi:hypothetical protein
LISPVTKGNIYFAAFPPPSEYEGLFIRFYSYSEPTTG